MKQKIFLDIVPEQQTGSDIESEATTVINDGIDPKTFYDQARQRLLNVNGWHELAGTLSAKFQAVDPGGKEVERPVKKGDYMRINIPGPGNKAGDEYDWVRVEEIQEIEDNDMQSIGFRVRPTNNPLSDDDSTAHFYNDSGTSNFIITREGYKITASIIDRNLSPNTKPDSLIDKIRDAIVGAGAVAGFSKIQWQTLADGLVEIKE